MALVLHLKYAENLRGKSDRLAKVCFRGVAHYSKIVENGEDNVVFDETFEWPVARPIESEEQIEIQVFNYNKYLSNRLVGTFRMVMQQLVEVGQLKVTDCMIDANNVMMKTDITFELKYNAPDGSVGQWQKDGFDYQSVEDDGGGGGDEEKNLLVPVGSDNESVSSSPRGSASRLSIASRGSQVLRSPTRAMKSVKSLVKVMKFGKQRPPPDAEERQSLIASRGSLYGGDDNRDEGVAVLPTEEPEFDNMSEGQGSVTTITGSMINRSMTQHQVEPAPLKAQDFQVCVTIIEARQLAGLNMDPVVCVQVGDQKKYTSVKESTNCPYYNEYFVFDFHMAPAMLFDKIITLTVLQSRSIIRGYKALGSFKLDVATVFSAPDHQFYHKWAMLTDPDDVNGGPKGYLKCDIAVVGKGNSIKTPPKTDKDDDDIEANLLLPEGVPSERQRARFVIKVYKAEGLPKMNTGIMANVKRALTGEAKDLVDPYVMVSFAGHKGKTTVKKGAYEPVWNEQIVFTEMFPPLCRRFKVQLRDNDSVNDDIIGTQFIDLSKISNEGEKGFLPTFGPCWINLYGSTRNYTIIEEHSHLNEGMGEGVSYRGRLLVALKTEMLDSMECGPCNVEVENAAPLADGVVGKLEEYFLFGTILDATMIDKKIGEKPIKFELSIGNYGNMLDGQNVSATSHQDSDEDDDGGEEDDDEEEKSSAEPEWNSTTIPIKPTTRDKFYYFLPFEEEKPILYVKGRFEDHRKKKKVPTATLR